MAETGANDTVAAEDDFGLIQEVSSLCPPPVSGIQLYNTWHLRSYPGGQQLLSSFPSSLHYRSSSIC